MPALTLSINDQTYEVDAPEGIPLLWVLRDKLNLVGTKYSCGIGVCGSCNVLVGGMPVKSCITPAAALENVRITTIEGLDPTGQHPVQKAWQEEDVAQCGYCQAGQILAAVSLLQQNPNPDDAAIDEAMAGVLCRCGTYVRIRRAIKLAAEYLRETGQPE